MTLDAVYSSEEIEEITPKSIIDYQIPASLTKELFSEPGTFTIEVLTQTDFTENPESLMSSTFDIPDLSVRINANNITTSE